MKRFKLTQEWSTEPMLFTEDTAPTWLRNPSKLSRGSTMDNMWFWEGHVLTLEIGETVDTEFSTIERIE